MKKLFIDSDKRKTPLKVGGFDITVLASTHDTMGYEIFVQKGQEGKGPGPHFHPWDETFYILNGKLHCGIDEDEFVALPGTLVHIPGGKTHWFKFGVGGAEFLAQLSTGSTTGSTQLRQLGLHELTHGTEVDERRVRVLLERTDNLAHFLFRLRAGRRNRGNNQRFDNRGIEPFRKIF